MSAAETPASASLELPNHNMEEEAYEPTYAEAFPPLPGAGLGTEQVGSGGEGGATMATIIGAQSGPAGSGPNIVSEWNSKMSMRSSTVTQVRDWNRPVCVSSATM